MSDTLNTTIRIETEDRASSAIRKIEDNLKSLERQIKKTFGRLRMPALDQIAGTTNRQRVGAALGINADTKALKAKLAFEGRIAAFKAKTLTIEEKARAAAERADATALKTKITGMAKVAQMRDRFQQEETRAKAAAEKAELRAIRERVAFGARVARQRAGEERAAAREEAAGFRERVRLDQYRMNLRARYDRDRERDHDSAKSDVFRHGRDGARHASDAFSRSTRGAAAAGVAGAVGTGVMLRKSFGAEADIDSAEINARIYAGLSKNAARELRDKWAAPLAESLGVGTDKLLNSYTDAIKLGIPTSGAKEFAGLATKTSEAWNVPFETVSDTLGTINSLLTSSGQVFDFGKLKNVANSLQHLAAKQSTTPEKMISFLKRGAGGAQVLGMSQESGLAFGSASTSLGNDAAESGRLLDYMASRIIDLPKLVEKKGDEANEARNLVKALGYTGVKDLDARRRADPDSFLPDFMQRFSGIADPGQREKALRFFAGKEWLGEMGRMVTGGSTYKEAAQLAKESKNLDAIGEVWDLHKQKLVFVGKQFSSGWKNILGEFGKELSPLARQAGDYFLDWSAKLRQGGLSQRFKAAITGFIEGLGFKDLPDLLKGMFGAPGEGNAGSIKAWADAARGFGQGLRDVGNTIASFFNVFTGGNATPEVIGKWTGRILAFSLACMFAAPVIGILGSIGGALAGFTLAAAGAWRVLKGLGLVGGAAAGAAGAAADNAGKAAKGGFLSRLFGSRAGLGVAGAAAGGAMLGMSKEESDALMLRLGKYARERNGTVPDQTPAPVDPATKAADELRALREALDGNAKLLKQNYQDGSGLVPRLHKASFGPDEGAVEFKRGLERLGAKIEMAALGGSERPRLIGRRGVPETIAPPAPRVSIPPRVFGPVPGVLFGRPGAALDRFGTIGRRGILGGGAGGGVGASDNSPVGAFRGSQTFDGMAPRIMADLRKDFGFSKEQAAGVLGNLGHESGGLRQMQELAPSGGGRGGYGWAQWTGSRRRAYEKWCADKGLDPRSYEANYSFLRHELQTTHRNAVSAVKGQNTAQGAMVAFENTFEKAGVKAWGSRQRWTRRALGLPEGQADVEGASGAQEKPFTSTGWKPAQPGNGPASPSAKALAQPSAEALAGSVPSAASRVGQGWQKGAGGNSQAIHAPITIQGGNSDPETLAQLVQKRLSETGRTRQHDLDFQSI